MLKDISHFTEKYYSNRGIGDFTLKTTDEISQLRDSAHLVRDLLLQLHKIIKPGVNELDIESFCKNYILIRGAEPYVIMISKNNVAFHGIPKNIDLKEGDLITVDVVLKKNGWFGDGAWTYEVGICSKDKKEILDFSHNIIFSVIDTLIKTRNLASIAKVIQNLCKKTPYRVLEEGAGHGIGLILHEDPQILFGDDAEDIELETGMVFTIEPVITNYIGMLSYSKEGAAYVDKGFLCSQFEHMVVVNENGLEILTDRNPLFK